MNSKKIKFIDLFAGVGGIRLGFERACEQNSFVPECVFTSEIDDKACDVYRKNFKDNHDPKNDITKIDTKDLPKYDVLLAGFPCQAFSVAGKRGGFEDTRGTLFFDVARIIKDTRPKMFLLENVKGLTNHNKGRTFDTILNVLCDELGYKVHYKILNAKDYGLPQNRERVYIVGFDKNIDFDFPEKYDYVYAHPTIWEIMDVEPDKKYYLSERYWTTLKNHKERHKAKGNGFGYEIVSLNSIANTIVCGGMGKERNLLIDDFGAYMIKDYDKNKNFIRKMTPLEWERLQGFPDNWTDCVADTHRYKQMGNSVAVNVIYEVCNKMLLTYEKC